MGVESLYILFNTYLSRGAGGVESQEDAERGRLRLMLHGNHHMGAFYFMFCKFRYSQKKASPPPFFSPVFFLLFSFFACMEHFRLCLFMTLHCSETPGGGHCGQNQRRHPPLSQPHMPGSGRAHTADQLEAQRHPHCGRLGRESELSAPRGSAGEVCDEER